MPHENFEGEELFLVEGTLSEVQHSLGKVNLLEKIQHRSREKNLAVGIANAVTDMHGLAANSAALVFYDGEDVWHFAGLLGNEVLCGTFSNADQLQNGDQIKAVVSRRGDVLFAHGLICVNDDLMFMPTQVIWGTRAFLRHCMRFGHFCAIVAGLFWVCALVFLVSDGPPEEFIPGALLFAAPSIAISAYMYFSEYRMYKSLKGTAEYAEAIFRVFGFPCPEEIKLDVRLQKRNGDAVFTFDYRKAIAKALKRTGSKATNAFSDAKPNNAT